MDPAMMTSITHNIHPTLCGRPTDGSKLWSIFSCNFIHSFFFLKYILSCLNRLTKLTTRISTKLLVYLNPRPNPSRKKTHGQLKTKKKRNTASSGLKIITLHNLSLVYLLDK